MAVIVALATAACNSNDSKTTEETSVSTDTSVTVQPAPTVSPVVYACSMHPEVTGQKGDKCPKCGMDLTEVAKNSSATDTAPGTVN